MTLTPPEATHDERIARVERGLRIADPSNSGNVLTNDLRSRMEALAVPGVSVVVIGRGSIAWARGYGVREAGGSDPVTPATRFQAASISKPVTALAALRLVDAGVLDLDADVNDILTSWQVPSDLPDAGPVTIRRLVSHTAGLTVHGFPGYAREEPKPTLLQVLNGEPPANTAPVRVDIPPGTVFRYSGGATTVLQLLLTEVMAKPFPDLMSELVLAPLGMRQSTFEQPLPEVLRDEVSTAHRAGAKPILGSWHVYPEMAAAGLWTTPSDLARFALAIESARSGTSSDLLLRRLAREMFTPQIEGGPGLGIFLDGVDGARRFGHSGGNEGFRCELVAYQDLGLGAVVMTNSDDGNYLVYELLGAIAAEYGWPAFREEREPAAVDVAMLGEYTGVYEYERGYEVKVTRDGDTLRLVMPGGASIVLLPAGKNRFYSLSMGGEVEFVRDEGDSTLIMRQGPVESRLRKQD